MRLFYSLVLLASLPAASTASGDIASLIARGDALDAQMKTAEALEVYLQAEKLDPKNSDLLCKIAKQYGESMVDISSKAGQRAAGQNALDYSLRAVRVDPDNADTHLAAAICYGRLINFVPVKEKVEYSRLVKTNAERAVKIDPNSDYAWHILGRWHRGVATTGVLLKGIVEVVYGGLPKAGMDEAIAAFEKAVALNPKRVSHHIELGITYAEAGETAKAKAAIKRGLEMPNRERDDPETKARGREALGELQS